jgi:two-component system CheB/CheR fusion protein
MVVVDREMRVVVWNRHCEDLWGLRSDETTDTVFTSLDMGLPLERIRPLIANAFVDSGQAGEVTVDAVNRRGRHTRIRVSCTAFRFAEGGVKGALLLMEELA